MSQLYQSSQDQNKALINLQQNRPNYFLPGGEQWVTQLTQPHYIGSYGGHMYDAAEWWQAGDEDEYQWRGEDIGAVTQKFDYSKLGISDEMLRQLEGVFTARGTGSMKDEGMQWGTWDFDPTSGHSQGQWFNEVETVGDYQSDRSTMDLDYLEGTGTGGSLGFLDYTNIFDRNEYAKMLEMITGEPVDASLLPQFEAKDIAEMSTSYYTPMEVGARANLLDSIMAKYNKVGSGGFAGSGSRQRNLKGIRSDYTDEMESVWANIGKSRQSAEERFSNKISSAYDVSRG